MENASLNAPRFDLETELDVVELHRLVDLTQAVWTIFPLVLVVVGTLGNVLSILVLTRPEIGHSSMTLYLTVLAISDTLCLYLGAFNYWLVKVYNIELASTNQGLCKTYSWLLYTFLDFSPWLLVAVTVERVVCVWMPHQVKVQFTRRRSAVVIVTILVSLMIFNAHMIGGTGLHASTVGNFTSNETGLTCGPLDPSYRKFMVNVWPWLDLCVFSLIPVFILIIGSTLIIIKVTRSARKRSSLSGNRSSDHQFESRALERRRLSSLTMVLLSLITVFTVSTTPVSIFLVLQKSFFSDMNLIGLGELAWAIVSNVMYLANALNIFTFIICGSRLRHAFCKFFMRSRSRRVPATCTTSASLVTTNTSRERRSGDTGAAGCFSCCPRLRHHSPSRQASTESDRLSASCPNIFHVECMHAHATGDSSSRGLSSGILNAALHVECMHAHATGDSSSRGLSSGILNAALHDENLVDLHQRPKTKKSEDSVPNASGRKEVNELSSLSYVENAYHVSPLRRTSKGERLSVRDIGMGSHQSVQERDYAMDRHPQQPIPKTHQQTIPRHLAASTAGVAFVSVESTYL